MKKSARKLEELFIDITFAGDRKFDSVKEALKKVAQIIEDAFTAIVFSEAGEFETAVSYNNRYGEETGSHRAGYPPRTFNKLCSGRV